MHLLQTLAAVGRDFRCFFWPTAHWRKAIRIGGVVLVLLVGGRFLLAEPATSTELPETFNQAVTLTSPASVAASNGSTYIGTVRSVSEAQIQNETAGRVTSVAVQPGDQVAAGTIIATLENSTQRAAVLQAEGAYEAALAAAAQSETGVDSATASLEQARNTAVSAVRGAVNTYNTIVINTIDDFFSNPDGVVPGVRINSRSTSELNSRRIALTNQLATAQQTADTLTVSDDLPTAITETKHVGEVIITLLDILLADVRDAKSSATLDGAAVSSYRSELTSARSTMVNAQASLNSAATGLTQAQTALTQAEQASVSSAETVSAADAQVKSALGSLRAAQAQLAKTILRTPVAGTVNDVAVNTGDFISAFTQVAEVANNGSLEVRFFVTETEAASLTVGQTIRAGKTATGTIVSIAPAVNQATQKTEVRAALSDTTLTNGSSVSVTPIVTTAAAAEIEQPMRLPLTAVRFTASDGSVFLVEDGVLVSRPVTIGGIRGSTVIIESGIDRNELVVTDVRGLTTGQAVTVLDN